LLEYLARRLALTKPRQPNVFDELAKRALFCRGEFVRANGNVELDLRRRKAVECRGTQGVYAPKRGAAVKMERKTRFELATLALARRCSTTELLPRLPPTNGNYVGTQRLEL
jgi:hypothetical protein